MARDRSVIRTRNLKSIRSLKSIRNLRVEAEWPLMHQPYPPNRVRGKMK